MFEVVLDHIPAIRMPTGRRRRRPSKVHGDKAYDHRRCRAYLSALVDEVLPAAEILRRVVETEPRVSGILLAAVRALPSRDRPARPERW